MINNDSVIVILCLYKLLQKGQSVSSLGCTSFYELDMEKKRSTAPSRRLRTHHPFQPCGRKDKASVGAGS